MYLLGIPATIMSLGGIAIAIGATVDAEIVMIEACHKKLEHAPPGLDAKGRAALLHEAAKEVTPAIFFSLIIIALSFVPVFGLDGQGGRLFKPLAYTKTFVMLSAAIVSITLAPALRDLLVRGKIRSEKNHPVSRAIMAVYQPFVYVALRRPKTTLAIGLFALLSAIPAYLKLGSEFMPPLNEGDLLYMPTTLPNLSIEEAKRQLERQDRILAAFPEVKSVFGKVGRAESATDPAPLSMVETIIPATAERGVAAGPARALVPRRPGVREGASAAALAGGGARDLGRAGGQDERRAPAARLDQRVDDAHQDPCRHAHHRRPHAGGHQGVRRRSAGDRGRRHGARDRAAQRAGDAERLLRALAGRRLRGRRAEA